MSSPTALGAEIEAYQALLEAHRARPHDDELYEDLLKARAAMERAWLQSLAAVPPREA